MWLHNNSALCVLLQWRQEAKLHSSLLAGKTEWVSISISHQCLSLPQSKAAIVSRAELMGINRNKQNKTRHHHCCRFLSFFMSIIPSLFYSHFSFLFYFLAHIFAQFLPSFTPPLCSAYIHLLCSRLPPRPTSPTPPLLSNGQLSCVREFTCECVLSVCTECCEWPLLADWRELKWFMIHRSAQWLTPCKHTGKKSTNVKE